MSFSVNPNLESLAQLTAVWGITGSDVILRAGMLTLRNSSLSFLVSHPFISLSPNFSISISLYIYASIVFYALSKQHLIFFLITFSLRVYSSQSWSSHCFQMPGKPYLFQVWFFSGINFPLVFLPPLSFSFDASDSPFLWQDSLSPDYEGDLSARPTTLPPSVSNIFGVPGCHC